MNPVLLALRKSFLHQQSVVNAYRERMDKDLDDAVTQEVSEMPDVFEKIDAGHYETRLEYPELDFVALRSQDPGGAEEKRSRLKAQVEAYNADAARLNEEFRRDTLAHHGVPEADLDDPFLKLLVELVWEDCVSHDEGDYVTTLERWLPLYHLYKTSPFLQPRA